MNKLPEIPSSDLDGNRKYDKDELRVLLNL